MFKDLTAVGQICSLGENLLILLRNQEHEPQEEESHVCINEQLISSCCSSIGN